MDIIATSGLQNEGRNDYPALSFAPDQIVSRYRRHIEHFGLSETQKAELLLALWQITGSFVDRAFGDDPAQLSRKDGDDFHATAESGVSPVVISRDHPATENKNDLSDAFGQQAAGNLAKEKR